MKSKTIYSLIGLVIALLLGGQIGSYYSLSGKLKTLEKDLSKQTNVTSKNNTPTNTSEDLKVPEYGTLIRVTKVIDGDTIELENGEHLRYIGIDTPEKNDPRKPVQCFAEQASQKNKELVEGKMIKFYKDIDVRDKYQRLLGFVYLVDGTFVNLELVKTGYAFSYPYVPDISRQEEFNQAQATARNKKLGLWSGCSITEPTSGRYQTNPVGDN